MPDSPDQEWRRLSGRYARMCDEELLELAADFKDLTELAQLTLRDEMKRRGFGDPASKTSCSAPVAALRNLALEAAEKDTVANTSGGGLKTLLCECKRWEDAWRVQEALQGAGLESWVESTRGYDLLRARPRVVVSAHEIERAQAILSQAAPEGIADGLSQQIPEYIPPRCPKCQAEDPVLESADLVNAWHCEACEHRWREPVEDPIR